MYFIETSAGRKVGTATAYYEPADRSGAGWLHWVAVHRDYQGKGLARPLIAQALNRLVQLGYSSIKIPTQTNTWLAASIYLDFGFHPFPPNLEKNLEGYRILKTITDHPALKEYRRFRRRLSGIWKMCVWKSLSGKNIRIWNTIRSGRRRGSLLIVQKGSGGEIPWQNTDHEDDRILNRSRKRHSGWEAFGGFFRSKSDFG